MDTLAIYLGWMVLGGAVLSGAAVGVLYVLFHTGLLWRLESREDTNSHALPTFVNTPTGKQPRQEMEASALSVGEIIR
jgi:hypothetical protein